MKLYEYVVGIPTRYKRCSAIFVTVRHVVNNPQVMAAIRGGNCNCCINYSHGHTIQ